MPPHRLYEERGREPDFIVQYEYIPSNKGTKRLYQGIRCDWRYAEDDSHSLSMIWPQFIGADGQIVPDTETHIADAGMASMWILFSQAREYHRPRIREGVRGFFVVGPHEIARAIVTKVVGLSSL